MRCIFCTERVFLWFRVVSAAAAYLRRLEGREEDGCLTTLGLEFLACVAVVRKITGLAGLNPAFREVNIFDALPSTIGLGNKVAVGGVQRAIMGLDHGRIVETVLM